MKRFVLLFNGGEPSEDNRESNMDEWKAWIGMLTQKDIYESGLPFMPGGKKVKGPENTVEDLEGGLGKLSGYAVIKAESIDEACEIAKGAPHQKYGGKTKIREAMEMPNV